MNCLHNSVTFKKCTLDDESQYICFGYGSGPVRHLCPDSQEPGAGGWHKGSCHKDGRLPDWQAAGSFPYRAGTPICVHNEILILGGVERA